MTEKKWMIGDICYVIDKWHWEARRGRITAVVKQDYLYASIELFEGETEICVRQLDDIYRTKEECETAIIEVKCAIKKKYEDGVRGIENLLNIYRAEKGVEEFVGQSSEDIEDSKEIEEQHWEILYETDTSEMELERHTVVKDAVLGIMGNITGEYRYARG